MGAHLNLGNKKPGALAGFLGLYSLWAKYGKWENLGASRAGSQAASFFMS
ncbi:hypothetical protein KS461_10005 [Pseudomonas chlororaphis]|nr:hypothetical protein [Pseudomonas chlororaphis]UVE47594.1 hypothetical protein KS461_10005 [Pseudomonas chlororaphis]